MASKKKSKQEGAKLEPCDVVEVPVPADYPFGSLLCRKEHEGVFKQLFQAPLKPKDDSVQSSVSVGCV